MQAGKIVETATVKELFSSPQHAYTRKLIAASPTSHSTLEDLTLEQETTSSVAAVPANSPQKSHDNESPLLEVIDLVKEFPKHGALSLSEKEL